MLRTAQAADRRSKRKFDKKSKSVYNIPAVPLPPSALTFLSLIGTFHYWTLVKHSFKRIDWLKHHSHATWATFPKSMCSGVFSQLWVVCICHHLMFNHHPKRECCTPPPGVALHLTSPPVPGYCSYFFHLHDLSILVTSQKCIKFSVSA